MRKVTMQCSRLVRPLVLSMRWQSTSSSSGGAAAVTAAAAATRSASTSTPTAVGPSGATEAKSTKSTTAAAASAAVTSTSGGNSKDPGSIVSSGGGVSISNSSSGSKSPGDPIQLKKNLKVAVYWDTPATSAESAALTSDTPIAVGRITAQLSHNLYVIAVEDIALTSVIEVGSRVFMFASALSPPPPPGGGPPGAAGATTTALAPPAMPPNTAGSVSLASGGSSLELVAGLVARVNANGTVSVLLDNDRFEAAVPRSSIVLSEGRSRLIHNDQYMRVLNWVKQAGIDRRSDQEGTAIILYHRGWREDKLYLLEAPDVHCLSHLNKSVRMCLLEKAEWERDHHRQRRELSKERLKEREWRYVLTKYSGVFSACIAVLGVMSVFTWNFKNWQKQQRSYQLSLAVESLKKTTRRMPAGVIVRLDEEDKMRRVLRRMDLSHPRILVCTGPAGSGKSHLLWSAASREHIPIIQVDVRGNEDPMRTLVKALGVQNIEACGDLTDFVAEACLASTAQLGAAPIVDFKLRLDKDNLGRVYHEALALACDRRCSHVVIEINVENMSIRDGAIPRCDFFYVPNFTFSEAIEYSDHLIDPLDMIVYADVCGTNSTDLDELLSAVTQQDMEASAYTRHKMGKAMRHLQLLWGRDARLRAVLTNIAAQDFETGLRGRKKDVAAVLSAVGASADVGHDVADIIYYNPMVDAYMFRNKVYHSAASCWKAAPIPVAP